MKKRNLLFAALMFVAVSSYGQYTGQSNTSNVITTAVPFVSIAPDAHAGAMGDCGVVTVPDVYSMYYNPAKYAFLKDRISFGLGYTPWLRAIVPDMNFANTAAAFKINDHSAVAGTLRYFSCGEIEYRDQYNQSLGTYRPNEFAMDIAYSYRFGDYFSVGTAGRFIYSNLTQGSNKTKPGISLAGDISAYYNRPLGEVVDFSLGASITNIGSKISYSSLSSHKDFIPTTLRMGTGVKYTFNPKNSLAICLEFSKLLVPTPPVIARDQSGIPLFNPDGTYMILDGMDNNVSVLQGMIQSFYDAPGCGYNSNYELINYGKSYEEFCEINTGIGLEYNLANKYFFRSGYFHESVLKGSRQFMTFGAGIRFGIFGMDLSYLLSTRNVVGSNPLSNTFRADIYFAFK